jgi:hypothetical protein
MGDVGVMSEDGMVMAAESILKIIRHEASEWCVKADDKRKLLYMVGRMLLSEVGDDE